MRQTKYITSGGLAFSENKDMEKLRNYSLKGWHVSDFSFMGYTLKKGEKSDYIYSVDYRWLKEDEEEEYFDFFSSAGWSHVASEGDIHLFQAHPGTKPIYTDQETTIEKYKNSSKSMKSLAIPFVFITGLAWVGTIISSGTLKTILLVVAAILSVIAIPIAWTAITTYSNKWGVEGRRGIVNLVKAIPFLLLFVAVVTLLFVGGTDTTIDILASMVIGAFAFPAAIWVIMSLFHKISKKKELEQELKN